jgi:hypothetical protein
MDRESIIEAISSKVKKNAQSDNRYTIILGLMMNEDTTERPKYLDYISINNVNGKLEFGLAKEYNVSLDESISVDKIPTKKLEDILNWLSCPDSFEYYDKHEDCLTHIWKSDIDFLTQIVGKHDILEDIIKPDEDGEIVCGEEELKQIARTEEMSDDLAWKIQCRMQDYIDEDDYDTRESLAMTIGTYDIKVFIIPIIIKKYGRRTV